MKFGLIKREPSYFFENIHEDLERFLKETFGELEPVTIDNKPFERTFRPAVQVAENKNEYIIDVELTGVKKEDIEVEVTDSLVSIKAETKFEKRNDEDNIHYSEFKYGKFVRNIPLEHKIEINNSTSEYKNGILHINLAKKEPDREETAAKLTIN